jgi:tetratricopeptide (TPR) repeat protein
VRAFNVYRGDPVALVDNAIECAPEFAMAYILKAYLFDLATEPEATLEATAILARAKGLAKTEREISHIEALASLLANSWTEAAVKLDHHNMQFPHDLVALQAGHLMDFYRASSRNLRDRIARILPKWSEDRPGYSIVIGMYAFGLEEAGNYAHAEAMGREALARDPLDFWAHHAVAHVMEMQGRAEDGIGWMQMREPHWSGDDNFFKVHNWWHKALYHLDLGRADEVISLYDARLRREPSAVALDLVDASALLWRMNLAGHDVGQRWDEVASNWANHADGQLYPFNDWHAAMAYLGAGRLNEVDRLIKEYRSADPNISETTRWAQSTGLSLIEGFKAFWQGNNDEAVRRLHGARFIVNAFGGSHAQRDIIDWTLTEAAIRSGDVNAAETLANERIAAKPHSPINRRFLQRAKKGVSRPVLVA